MSDIRDLAIALVRQRYGTIPHPYFTQADPDTRVEQGEPDTSDCAEEGFHAARQADAVAGFADFPPECEVCGKPIRKPFGLYCSEYHRRIVEGEKK